MEAANDLYPTLDLLPGTYTALGLVGIERVLLWHITDAGAAQPGEPAAPPVYPSLRSAGQRAAPYFRRNIHLSRFGHAVVADEISSYLQEKPR